jgi:hypothetical protein
MMGILQDETNNQIVGMVARNDFAEEKRADMLEAMRSLTFLMRVDIENRENLHTYLTFMDCVLEKLATKTELPHAS